MRTVRDASGNRYLLVKESEDGESVRVRDPETGEQRSLDASEFEPVDGESPLTTASRRVPGEVRTVLTAVHNDRALGLLVELVDRGPLAVTTLLSAYDLCESDLHGLLGEFRAAGLVTETTVAGVRGYQATPDAERALELLDDDSAGTESDRDDSAGTESDREGDQSAS